MYAVVMVARTLEGKRQKTRTSDKDDEDEMRGILYDLFI